MLENKNMCPRCRATRLRTWEELSSDEKFVAERLPRSAELLFEKRETHLFCPRCWFETKPFKREA
jgi:hypothetical protein